MTDLCRILPEPASAHPIPRSRMVKTLDSFIRRHLKNGRIHFGIGIFGLGIGVLTTNGIVINLASALTITGFTNSSRAIWNKLKSNDSHRAAPTDFCLQTDVNLNNGGRHEF